MSDRVTSGQPAKDFEKSYEDPTSSHGSHKKNMGRNPAEIGIVRASKIVAHVFDERKQFPWGL